MSARLVGVGVYGKIFDQIFSSSIMEEELETRYLFMSMLAICETGGVVDITHEALARKINLDVEKVRRSINALQSPDPRSRSQNDDGRRLVLIDAHRDWGWIIVNYDKYKAIRSNEERREYMKEYMRRKRNPSLLTSCKQALTQLAKEEEEEEEEEEAKEEDSPPPPSGGGDGDLNSQSDEQKPEMATTQPKADERRNRTMTPFENFWTAYPRKRNKGQAEKAWRQLKPGEQLVVKILQGIERAKTSADWQKDCGQFIPYPATWLRAKGWEDEHQVEVPKRKSLGEILEAKCSPR